MLLTLPDVPLRTAPFSLPDRCLVWSRLRLYADRLVLSGWGLTGRYWRCIPLDEIEHIEQRGQQLAVRVANGPALSVSLSEAAQWVTSIEIRCVIHRASD